MNIVFNGSCTTFYILKSRKYKTKKMMKVLPSIKNWTVHLLGNVVPKDMGNMFGIIYGTHNKFCEDGSKWACVKVFRADWNEKYNYEIEAGGMLKFLPNGVEIILLKFFVPINKDWWI